MLFKDLESEATMTSTKTEIQRLVWPTSKSCSAVFFIYFLRILILLSLLTGTLFIFLCVLNCFINVISFHYIKEITLNTEFFEKFPLLIVSEEIRDEEEHEKFDQFPLLTMSSTTINNSESREDSNSNNSIEKEKDEDNNSNNNYFEESVIVEDSVYCPETPPRSHTAPNSPRRCVSPSLERSISTTITSNEFESSSESLIKEQEN